MLWQVIAMVSSMLFTNFLQSVLFLKALLSVIEGGHDFAYYAKTVLAFAGISLLSECIMCISDYKGLVIQKDIFKAMNNMIFKKAAEADISCYEDPEFYDKYQRATEILTSGYFIAFSYSFANVIAGIISFFSVIGLVAAIDASYLIFLFPLLFVFMVELIKSKTVFKRDLEMTTNNRIKAYAQRTLFLKDYAKDIRTSNIFSVIIKRFDCAVSDNIAILKRYGIKLFLFSMLSSLLGEFIPILGTYAYAGYQFAVTKNLQISGFSVVLSSINSVREAANRIANGFSELSAAALYFQNLHDFFNYETKIKSGNKKAGEFENLEFKNVCFKYPAAKKCSLQNLSFKINKGETVSVVGINGAGKTTLIRIINRITAPDSGEVRFNGHLSQAEDIYHIGYLPEERGLYKKMKVGEQAIYLAQLKGLSKAEATSRLKLWLEKFEITPWWNKKLEELSKGMQQKVQFIITILHKPQLLIFDEPFSGFDPVNAELLKREILELKKEGHTIIFSTHNMASVEEICDNIALINHSEVVLQGNVKEVRSRFKANTYILSTPKGQPLKESPLFEIVDSQPTEEEIRYTLQKQQDMSNSALLTQIAQQTEIISFTECLPSMNEIFIRTVEGLDKH